jgi:hypothetical protein
LIFALIDLVTSPPIASAKDANNAVSIGESDGKPLSAFDSDNVRLNLAVDGTRTEPLGDRFGCDVGCLVKPRFVTRLDLVS